MMLCLQLTVNQQSKGWGAEALTLRSVVKTPSLDLKLSWVLGHNSEKLIHMSTDWILGSYLPLYVPLV